MSTKATWLTISSYLALFLSLEILSYLALFNPWIQVLSLSILSLATLILSWQRLEFGLLILVAELLIGSMGRLLAIELLGFSLSLRMILWLIVMLVFLGKVIKEFSSKPQRLALIARFRTFTFRKYFLIIFAFIAWGLLRGLIGGNELSLIFSDANAWLYYLLIFPVIYVYHSVSQEQLANLAKVVLAGLIWLGLKTFFLLYVFTHDLSYSSAVYYWLRKTLVGEMTMTLSGWPRIFIQGQIFAILGLLLVLSRQLKRGKTWHWGELLGGALMIGVLLISFSRSFWLALIVTLLSLLVIIYQQLDLKRAITTALQVLVMGIMAFGLLYLTTVFPYPHSGSFSADFAGRANLSDSAEAAISSRWSLLPVLLTSINKAPILGQGFGRTITYQSADPRVLEKNPAGTYTTYAFEWGYLDLWLKLGGIFFLTYLWFLFNLAKQSYLSLSSGWRVWPGVILGGLIFIAFTNFFTPYLNHPLGIGFIVFGACLISYYRVY
ncbi:MAG: O-antigen ligase family protein [Patescibacteria group bacterium]|jgi:hypothetical protein